MSHRIQAFPDKKLSEILGVVKRFYENALAHNEVPSLTNEDVYRMLVKEEDILDLQKLENEAKRFNIYGLDRSLSSIRIKFNAWGVGDNAGRTNMYVRMSPPLNRVLPGYDSGAIEVVNMPESTKKIIGEWLDIRYKLGKDFAGLDYYIRKMNEVCSTPAQMKVYFGGIVSLMRHTENPVLIKQADKLERSPLPKSYPRMPREMAEAGVAFTSLVAWSLLVPTENPSTKPVSLFLDSVLNTTLDWAPGNINKIPIW